MTELQTLLKAGAEVVAGDVILGRESMGRMQGGQVLLSTAGQARLAELTAKKAAPKKASKAKAKAPKAADVPAQVPAPDGAGDSVVTGVDSEADDGEDALKALLGD